MVNGQFQRIIKTSYTVERESNNGTDWEYVHPILIPKSAPKFHLDTRRSRASENFPPHYKDIGCIEKESEINGKKEIHKKYERYESCPEGFAYKSDNNNSWLTIQELQNIIRKFEK